MSGRTKRNEIGFMILFSIGLLVILPLASLANLLFVPDTFLEWLVIASLAGTLFALVRIVGRWYWINYKARHVSLAVLLFALGYSYFKLEPAAGDSSQELLAINLTLLIICLIYLIRSIRSATPPVTPYTLVLPFRGKKYYVSEGGSSRLTNHHHVNQAQRYAVDFCQLNSLGRRCKGFYPENLEHYVIFGKPIYSPAAGTILMAQDGLQDMTPPELDEVNRAGNHVLIKTDDDKYIVMAHMKQGSVTVKEGDRVETGSLLGEVGSSGRSEEPHLHIHCMDTLEEDYVLSGHGIPIQFDGRYLVRNQLVSGEFSSSERFPPIA